MSPKSPHAAPSTRQPWFLGPPLRRLRLFSGLVLFAYVLTHLLNHAVLNVSVDAADRVLLVQKFIWQGAIGTAALYGALLIHTFLGVWALYQRRYAGWRPPEVWQLALGLCVPAMLANHIMVTRGALDIYGLDKGYIAETYALWVAEPWWGYLQSLVLVAAWAHGCIGLYFLLRLRRWYGKAHAPLLALAVLIPALALLGFAAGGREVDRALAQPGYRSAHLLESVTGTPAQKAELAAWRNDFLICYALLIGLALAARLLRSLLDRRRARFTLHYPGLRKISVPAGHSVLEASRRHRIPHASVCGGKGRCSTCRVRVLWSADALPQAAAHERAVLLGIGADPQAVRLACQLRPRGDLSVVPLIPPEVASEFVLGRAPRIPGDERFLAVMFVDLRGSTRMAERRMPFDSVFLLGRFIASVTRVTVACGGAPVQFLGDGLLSVFGLDTDGPTACRQALSALDRLEAGLAELEPLFGQETGEAMRYGIGLHCGRAVVGEIGFGGHVAFTALGDTVNLAHRLQEYAKDHDASAAVSADVFRVAGEAPRCGIERVAILRGRAAPVAVRLLGPGKAVATMSDSATV
jgi:adenylate cyclase